VEGETWIVQPQPKYAIASLPPGEYKRGAIPPFAKLPWSLLRITQATYRSTQANAYAAGTREPKRKRYFAVDVLRVMETRL